MNVANKPSKHKAAGQYLGYSEQEARLCYCLLSSPDDAEVVMEGEDDVAIRFSEGGKVLEQVKSATKHNALSDWSKDLWKTIGNWVSDIQSGEIDLYQTTFRLYVTPSQSGDIAAAIHATNFEQAAKDLRQLILKKRDALERKPKCNKFVEAFLGLDADRFLEFVTRISVESVHERPEHSVEALWGPSYNDETKRRLTNYAIGLARDKANELIKSGAEGVVNAGSFKKEIRLSAARLNLPAFLASRSTTPTAEVVASVHSKRPQFVRQLEVIAIGQDQETRAIADYLRTSADKTIWAEEGDIAQSDLDDLDRTLIRSFGIHKGEVEDFQAAHSVEVQGRQLFRLCLRTNAKLAGQEVPDHFVPGTFHELADRPETEIGWHPEFRTILGRDD
ncbi:ABC-three component system protein [Sulfitobacter sp. EE-36]|uniref:ABC-three component system protein n=1 Tax=Sulfitobacter TaxID=60136 RepID=UPI000066AFBD|nr:ABC-three component system protein [Sulfitobacter sp. EE-36]EAP84030.1 hypothetical protein EE36_13228 [Sulfitobacter sp. EE-36]